MRPTTQMSYPLGMILLWRFSLTLGLCFVKLAGSSRIPEGPLLPGTGHSGFICPGKNLYPSLYI